MLDFLTLTQNQIKSQQQNQCKWRFYIFFNKFIFIYLQTYIEAMKKHQSLLISLPTLQRKQKSVTQTMSPLFRKFIGLKSQSSEQKNKGQVSIQVIREEYATLSKTMDDLERTLHLRMGYHQIELLDIMKQQVLKILQDVKKVVKVYNQMIKQKNYSQDLWQTRNQVQYFKFEAFRLFQQNKLLRKQILELKRQIGQLNFNQECQVGALKKMAKKLARQKAGRSLSSHLKCDNKKSKIDNEQNNQAPKSHKRHESMYTQIIQRKQRINISQQLTPKHLLSSQQSEKNRQIKTRVETNQKFDLQTKLRQGFSEKINIKNNQLRDKKIKLFKQKKSFGKNASTQLTFKVQKYQKQDKI